jgi:hypothetical protein
METILKILRRYATVRNTSLAAVLFLALAMGVMLMAEAEIKHISTGAIRILDLQFGYSTATVYGILDNMGAAGRQMYLLAEWTADVIYPIVSLVFFAFLLTRLRSLNGLTQMPFLPLLPFATWAFDLLENIGLTVILINYPNQMPTIVAISSILTLLKWAAAFTTMGTVLFLTSRWLIARRRRKWSSV